MHPIPLDAPRAPLTGTQAIEASAGTGKTWSIAALYLRLVVEAGLPVERLLVVTYTTAATAELRDRIRARLIAARSAFAGGEDQNDPVLAELRRRIEPARAEALLTLAIESFDLAAIHTIHGFCQRALEERAFESGEDFETTLVGDETALLQAIAEDFWRKQMALADAFWARWLVARLNGPFGLVQALRGHFGKPYLKRLLPEAPNPDAEAAFVAQRDALAPVWQRDGQGLTAMLCGWKGLSAVSHKPEQIARAAQAVDAWFASGGELRTAPEGLKKFSEAALKKATTKAAAGTPEDPLFGRMQDLLAAIDDLNTALERRLGHLLATALDACEEALARRKAQLGRLGFDDLLTRLAAALRGDGGPRLAERLQERYGAALIDEFQDTDPVQYEIFERVFHRGGLPLFFVGDPKQAIYSFRGADLHAYLEARQQAAEHWALSTNRRSVPGLVAAVNSIFERRDQAFRFEGLDFAPVAASPQPPAPLRIEEVEARPLSLWFLERSEVDAKGKPKAIPRGVANQRIAAAVAADIARLLRLADQGRANIGTRPLAGGDIAVLVKSHAQGRLMRNALAELGVASVRYGQDSVFDSREALEVERLLLAVAEPGRSGLVKAALVTDLLGLRGADIHRLDGDAAAWDALSQRFHEWHQLCRERGFVVMWHALLAQQRVAERLLLRPDGERRMTNLQHLSELLQQLAHDEGLSVDGLAKHLADSRRGEGDSELIDGEAKLLRLESDEQLVRIVTIHGSKGLEYPIVYCPWLWDGARPKRRTGPLAFHDQEDSGHGALDFGSARQDEYRAWADEEREQEQLRLAYVALTRAKHRCVLAWGGIDGAERSPLGWLLHGPLELKERDDIQLRAELAALSAACPGIEVLDLPEEGAEPWQPAVGDA
ncbi:MAG TPA: UvrD-helicase domain-containing protein, partial [Rhodocyclaceae bacterium]